MAKKELTIDLARCQGHARCWAIAPETFEIDEEGYGHVIDGREASFDEENVRKAIKNCPERSILIREVEDAP
ncbi:ferredoxin [Leucobacter weissii]|uniref:Ferredoxin n=1 Tax=Leucobacter weissii TaxID=1983706 RepID=A0A939S699_9MICO|nr:ferredoxin [Leucobacter weissii]MBO1902154.1 ferredoxin [Leucobacter weissii]